MKEDRVYMHGDNLLNEIYAFIRKRKGRVCYV